MSRRDAFVGPRQARWQELEQLLARRRHSTDEITALSRLVRAVSADLAAAQSGDLPDDVQAYLDGLAGRAHNALYGARRLDGLAPIRAIASDFPRELRANAGLFAVSTALFGVPYLVGLIACAWDPGLASQVVPEGQLTEMRAMYADSIGRGGMDADAGMAGFYVHNNVGIALRCFATGVFGGLGPIFFLAYNGAVIGAVSGYLAANGGGWNLLVFTSGHSAWELTGIVVSGTAGLRLGWALLVTRGASRSASLRAAGPGLFRLVVGFCAMLFVAAAIEGFWSASPIPAPIKLGFGALQAVVIALWLALGGRR